MGEQMEFPETFERFAKEYGFKDDKEVYTNGLDLIPIFRVKQWLEHIDKLRRIEMDTAYECGKHSKSEVNDTREEAIKTLKDNCCATCAYGSQNMDSCDIRGCDNKDAIKALEHYESVTEFADRCKECGARYGKLLKQKSVRMTNREKIFEDFGIKLESTCICTSDEVAEECIYNGDCFGCEKWLDAEFKERKGEKDD